eukprot:1144290-Pleurochrysis_carterae.AAC.5
MDCYRSVYCLQRAQAPAVGRNHTDTLASTRGIDSNASPIMYTLRFRNLVRSPSPAAIASNNRLQLGMDKARSASSPVVETAQPVTASDLQLILVCLFQSAFSSKFLHFRA